MHNFKKIVPRLSLILAFVILFEGGIRFLYEPYTQYSIYANKEYKHLKGTVDTIFCGTSKTYSSFDPDLYDEALGTVSFNLGTGSQPLSSTYALIEDAFRLNPIKTVYLEVSFPTLQSAGGDLSRIGAADRVISPVGKLKSILTEKKSGVQIRKLFYSTRVSDYFDFASVKDNVRYKLSDKKDTAPEMEDGEPEYLGRGFINNDNVYSGNRYTDTNIDSHSWKPEIHKQENIDLLNRIITLCQEKDAEIILISLPMPEVLLSHAGDMNDMHAYYQAIADNYGIKFFDMNFYENKNSLFTTEFFRDIVHLNRTGADLCTKAVAEIYESGDDYEAYFTEVYMGKVVNVSEAENASSSKASGEENDE